MYNRKAYVEKKPKIKYIFFQHFFYDIQQMNCFVVYILFLYLSNLYVPTFFRPAYVSIDMKIARNK